MAVFLSVSLNLLTSSLEILFDPAAWSDIFSGCFSSTWAGFEHYIHTSSSNSTELARLAPTQTLEGCLSCDFLCFLAYFTLCSFESLNLSKHRLCILYAPDLGRFDRDDSPCRRSLSFNSGSSSFICQTSATCLQAKHLYAQ